ncbi:dispatched homolog 1 [Seminavis robusta]|uniref:Dispatched homolog 1 n=1 Tax=Seminavis robusta TaxID=568900 RepID=A0A9N8DG88_9STRA|nr:dispatched homolog 1 [Seminavis robusta]|eukprot:Sro73_g040280.1 dispatched homolog 1 (1108) ;mRNA; r:30529-34286
MGTDNEQQQQQEYVPLQEDYSFLQRQAMRMARWPKTYFWIGFIISFGLSAVGMVLGEFSISNEEGGWQSRGTLIADRTTQVLMVTRHTKYLFPSETNEVWWQDLTNNVQPGWEDDDLLENRRLMEIDDQEEEELPPVRLSRVEQVIPTTMQAAFGETPSSIPSTIRQKLPMPRDNKVLHDFLARKLAEDNSTTLQGCDRRWYTHENVTSEARLWPVWKPYDASATALNPAIVKELCTNEQQTQRVLEENSLCITCGDTDRCLPPYGIVMYARLLVPGGMDMECNALAAAWGPFQAETEAEWKTCVEFIEANPDSAVSGDYRAVCPDYFHPALLDELFDTSGLVQYTSSVFATSEEMIDELYNINDQFGKGGDQIEGAYDTQWNDFVQIFADGAVESDMLLATGSAFITAVAILVHTRSPFLTLVGLVQIILSFPLAFFAYRFIGGFAFFPFLNFIGVFVVFALGADHVFVSVDKWKNARLDHPNASTEDVAAIALPDAAAAMLLTTTTTAVAFFGTAICPVAPVRLFAIFCGLLITFDYIMDIVLIFPCLCIYDGYRHNSNCCISLACCRGKSDDEDEAADGVPASITVSTKSKNEETQGTNLSASETNGEQEPEQKPMRISFIRRVLLGYYNFLHMIRWPLLVACAAALVVSGINALRLDLPVSGEVRIVSTSIEYEKSYVWRQNLLYEVLRKQGGSTAYVLFGAVPADTGDHSNPASWSTLVLDETFDASTTESQEYLRDYCPRFFGEEFALLPEDGFECSMNKFDSWLKTQAMAGGTATDIYLDHCDGAGGLPMDPAAFNPCIVAWSQAVGEWAVLARNGIVQTITFPFVSLVRYDSPNQELDAEWHKIENWMVNDQKSAPPGANKAFFSSQDFWWYDTNLQMFSTAYGSAGIAIAASALVILLSSRSLVMTLFSVLSIGYVLASVTAMMVAAGWTLGFLESICFAILIGVSVDFVIHFCHAYVSMPGEVAKEIRTRHAIIDMGPSILAAAITTMAGAMIMLFCVITFFTKFAFVLFFAIVQATIGSFVFFLTLTDTIGPSQPTYMADRLFQSCGGNKQPEGSTAASTAAVETLPASVAVEATKSPAFDPADILNEEIIDEIDV